MLMVFQVRGVVLPDGEERTLWVDGDTLRLDPVPNADVVFDGGWLVPGLVDVHTHPGTEQPGDELNDVMLRRHLSDHRDAGVLVVRTPGTADRVPSWVADDEEMPRVRSAGPWLATPGRFFPGYGRHVGENELVAAAVEEATASSGWCKVIGDWKPDDPPVSASLLKDVVTAVHAVGGRVAVHCQTAEGSRNAVLAGVDSLEHGMHIDPALVDQMAMQGTALVPTLTTFGRSADKIRAEGSNPFTDWWLQGWEAMPPTIRAAHEAGVLILAGTDSMPFGSVSEEIGWLVRTGLPSEVALGAGSWSARSWLGLPGLVDGAPADIVAFDDDPLRNPAVVAHPARVILRGRVIK
jgi:imidazolonepropionase-like amidohydrolase